MQRHSAMYLPSIAFRIAIALPELHTYACQVVRLQEKPAVDEFAELDRHVQCLGESYNAPQTCMRHACPGSDMQ